MIDNEKITQAINTIAATEEGQIFFAWLAYYCKFHVTAMDIDPYKNISHATKRGVYSEVRKHIKSEYLIKIEFQTNIMKEKK